MPEPCPGEAINLATNDGFGNDEDAPDSDYVVWQGETNAHSACVMFLHGALHLFDSGKELLKYTWIRKGVPLIDQAREALANNAFPLFVVEGTSAQKKAKIRHNAYLYQGFKQFTANVQTGTHCLFIFGHSLAENDDHILARIGRGRCKKLYVGLYGDLGQAACRICDENAFGDFELEQEMVDSQLVAGKLAAKRSWHGIAICRPPEGGIAPYGEQSNNYVARLPDRRPSFAMAPHLWSWRSTSAQSLANAPAAGDAGA